MSIYISPLTQIFYPPENINMERKTTSEKLFGLNQEEKEKPSLFPPFWQMSLITFFSTGWDFKQLSFALTRSDFWGWELTWIGQAVEIKGGPKEGELQEKWGEEAALRNGRSTKWRGGEQQD